MIDLGLDEYETIDPLVKDRKAEFKEVELIIKHKRIHDHGMYL
jgi:hypothetical protein